MPVQSLARPITVATTRDERSAVDVIVRAFRSDPSARWLWADIDLYLAAFPLFVAAFGGRAFANGTAYAMEELTGAALWLPPGVAADEEALEAVLRRTIPERDQDAAFSLFEQMSLFHPGKPHWHLPLIGVDPRHQGQGLGSALLKPVLERCDREGALAYLEASSPQSVPLYQRHGFDVLGTIRVGDSPPTFPMLREPKAT
jgi:GNAT superfamily N-acetyltransferase